jgi:hypothetical protein
MPAGNADKPLSRAAAQEVLAVERGGDTLCGYAMSDLAALAGRQRLAAQAWDR